MGADHPDWRRYAFIVIERFLFHKERLRLFVDETEDSFQSLAVCFEVNQEQIAKENSEIYQSLQQLNH